MAEGGVVIGLQPGTTDAVTPALPAPTRLGFRDVLRLGSVGVTTRPLRTVLAALGIAIGIAALVAVVGIPASNQAALRLELAALGPNLLTVAPGQTSSGDKAELPTESVAMVRRIAPVQTVSAVGSTASTARRTSAVPVDDHGGTVLATRLDLLNTLGGRVRQGEFLTAATERYPVAVLGTLAATRLGIELRAGAPAPLVWIGDRYFSVAGVLDALPLAPLSEYEWFSAAPPTQNVPARFWSAAHPMHWQHLESPRTPTPRCSSD
jgi:putative ABC transport system permease protein